MKTRIERDDLGEREIPEEAYYGIHSLRSSENFGIAKRSISRQMIKGLAFVKKSAAYANFDAGFLTKEMLEAVSLSCDEILNGRLHGQFITDLVQGGAGISMNMNANEVIANRANEMLGQKKGSYFPIHPINHVNLCQSTNDVIPTAGKYAAIHMTKKLIVEMKKLSNCYKDLAEKYRDTLYIGKTHLLDAAPISYGEVFNSTKYGIEKDIKHIESAMKSMLEINLGGTLIGTGINSNIKYSKKVIKYLSEFTGEAFVPAKNMIDSTRSLEPFMILSQAVKAFSINLKRYANDLRLLSTIYNGVALPDVQAGSTMNPGKVNPVIPEMVLQVVYYIEGNDLTIARACEAGEMEFNVNLPIILASLFESLTFIRRCIRTFREKCLEGLVVIGDNKNKILDNYVINIYQQKIERNKFIEIINKAKNNKHYVYEELLKSGIIKEKDLENIEYNLNNNIKYEENE